METQTSQHPILLVEQNSGISRMLAFALESQFGMNVFEATDLDTANQFLSTVSEIGLVVIGDFEKHRELLETLASPPHQGKVCSILGLSQKLKDPSILFSPGVLGVAQRATLVEDTVRLISEKFYRGEIVDATSAHEFQRIRTQLLLFVYPLAADVYIRLSPTKFLKIFREGDNFEEADFERYAKEKRIEFFYLRQENVHDFMAAFKRQSEKLLTDDKVEPAVIQAVAAGVHDTVRNIVQILGVTDEVRTLTKTNVDLVMKQVSKIPRLGDIFKRIQTETGQYIVSHSLAVAEIACILAGNVEWLSDVTFKKLILAALFHDITLKNHEVAKLKSMKEAQEAKEMFLLETLEDFRLHPVRAAEAVNLLGDTPADVDLIIRQHHERPDGSGFPTGISGNHFSPLACILIIAHDYVDFCLEKRSHPDFETFLKENRSQYSSGHFKRIAKSLEDKIKQSE